MYILHALVSSSMQCWYNRDLCLTTVLAKPGGGGLTHPAFKLKLSPVLPLSPYVTILAQCVGKLAQMNFKNIDKKMLFLFIRPFLNEKLWIWRKAIMTCIQIWRKAIMTCMQICKFGPAKKNSLREHCSALQSQKFQDQWRISMNMDSYFQNVNFC